MLIHLFRDHNRRDVFAFSLDPCGRRLPPAAPATQWVFVETIDTLTFAEPWDIGDFQEVLAGLERDGVYLFQGELIASAVTSEAKAGLRN